MAKLYPSILLADSTFNVINIKGLRTLNYASVTGVDKWFGVGVGFMRGNQVSEIDFKWQLSAMSYLVHEEITYPKGKLCLNTFASIFNYILFQLS